MDKAVEGNLPLCFVEQMAALTSTSLPLAQSEVQVSFVQLSNCGSTVKQTSNDNAAQVQNCIEKHCFVSKDALIDASQACSPGNPAQSILMSPLQAQDKDSICSMSASMLDKLRSELLSTLASATLPSTVPLYASSDSQLLITSQDNADETMEAAVDVTSNVHTSLPVIPVSNSGVTVLGIGCDSNGRGSINCNVTGSNVLLANDVPAAPTNTSMKNMTTVQLPIVELMMETPSSEGLQDNQEHLQIIEIIPVSSGHVYCVECNDSYIGGCNQHSTDYKHIPDSIIETRARASLPKCLRLKHGNRANKTGTTGVFCAEDIQEKVLFGPLEGVMLSEPPADKSNTWQLFQNGAVAVYVDCSSEDRSNWLMFMRRASNNAEQNVVVYQRGMMLYFVTCKPIAKEQELLYWYSAGYAQLLGLPKRPDLLLHCNICSEQFVSLEAVEGHKKKIHPNPSTKRRFCCLVCQKAFTSRHKVDIHMTKHTKIKPFACSQCGKAFTDKSNLRKHMKIHNGEKNYRCCHCDKQFRQKSHLDTHIVIHTGEKQLVCKYCDKRFARAGDLKQHTYIHTNDRNLECAVCGKRFHRQQNLSKHIRIHSKDEKRFPCDQCGKQFPDKYHRNRHSTTCNGAKLASQIQTQYGSETGTNSSGNVQIQKDGCQTSPVDIDNAEGS